MPTFYKVVSDDMLVHIVSNAPNLGTIVTWTDADMAIEAYHYLMEYLSAKPRQLRPLHSCSIPGRVPKLGLWGFIAGCAHSLMTSGSVHDGIDRFNFIGVTM